MACRKFVDLPVLDKNIIKGIPWAEKMQTILEDGLNKTLLYWCQMVLKLGESEEVINEWVNVFMATYEETCCDLVSDMELVQSNVLLKIEQLLQEFEQQCHTLQINMPVLGDTTQKLSLHQEQYELKKRINEYKKKIQLRRDELNKLLEKQLDLCSSLGKKPRDLKSDPLPSSEEIEEFQRHIEKLEVEKFNRLEKFITVKEELLEIVNELNLKPSSKFEQDVLSLDDSAFLVTDANMKQLELLHKNFIRHQKNVKEEISELRNKIDVLWNLLELDLKEREDFRQKYAGNTIDILEALRTEIKRCENLKRANIKVFIDKLRCELEVLWDKCHCSELMKMQFGFFHSDCYNEDLLQLHEVEIEKWNKYYEENKELLVLLEQHKELWNKMIELEESVTGPNRYNNRGGKLLKEEKERNKLSKKIPQIEEKIYDLANKYNDTHDISFTTFGVSVFDYITNLHEDRENAKKQKLCARKMQREQTLTPAKSALSIFPSSTTLRSGTPLSTTKRKLATPVVSSAKRLKVLSERNHNNQTPTLTQIPVKKFTTTVSGTSKRFSIERKKRLNKIRRISAQKEQAKINPNETFSTDYGKFQSEISNKDDCRSTTHLVIPISTPVSSRTQSRKTPNSIVRTPKTPNLGTPTNSRFRPRTPNTNNKLSTAKPNIKLIF